MTRRARYAENLAIAVEGAALRGDLVVPDPARGLVLFAHGSGSGRLSPRNQFVASTLQDGGLATLLFDLLTIDEERRDAVDRHLRFDIPLLAGRLGEVTDWVRRSGAAQALSVGYFGASTGAAAALTAAAERPRDVRAVVSRGGRVDLADESLGRVRAPTLLIVGGADTTVLGLNRRALEHLPAGSRLIVVPGASHLFEETGALEQVATAAGDWFSKHLG